ncbi:glycine-rich domain-containing protein 1 [Parachaetomium inaequale]|uniref:Glycine-rich domain-containing protein 1 n=1 Tax=Parachaetomium inaequale TaxID=2588326 RepID=A0AAN6PAF9_9PEZI|nr:glycine-rich domain-containing protein 1 [Parachaetomium inaequale]
MDSAQQRPSIIGPFNDSDNAPPPAYTAEASGHSQQIPPDATDAEAANLTAAFDNLRVSNWPVDPDVDTCLAHLKLLFAIQWLKEDVGFTDGLWGLWDAAAGPIDAELKARPEKGSKGSEESKESEKAGQKGDADPSVKDKRRNKNLEMLSQIREKRWALYVARAVDRYETWWRHLTTLLPGRPLTEDDMLMAGTSAYSAFPSNIDAVFHWDEDMLPPLDVLMVWHTHMLNPRAFLEDAMLAGMRPFWVTGLPWDLVNKAIDTHFNYSVSAECMSRWSQRTGLAWDNAKDSMVKILECPRCNTWMHIPWTTCELPEDYQGTGFINFNGYGYGDNRLQFPCPGCNLVICRELLAAAKFVQDHKALLGPTQRPMPGTLLDPKTGTPSTNLRANTFPNRLLKSGRGSIRTRINTLISFRANLNPTMNDVRRAIEKVFEDKESIKEIDNITTRGRYQLPAASRIAVRKMMSRYWENFSLFAVDLGGAVMRQGVFVEKMCKLDWLHSPSARDTMTRLLTKYSRFIAIMAKNPNNIAVPTLDVDLAWHTHQLSPSRYFWHTVTQAGRFIDHDDKIDDNTLSQQFEWTSKIYQERYGEVYSECTCWYCESIRSSHVSSIGKALGMSKHDKVVESFHASGASSLHPPSSSAHISSHPAVAPHLDTVVAPPRSTAINKQTIASRLAAAHKRRLDTALAKAQARAAKKGREPPKKEEIYYDHWGYPYVYTAPYVYPLWWTPGLYYGWYPGYVVACGAGAYGGCAAGTCGGGVAAGACGGAGVSSPFSFSCVFSFCFGVVEFGI